MKMLFVILLIAGLMIAGCTGNSGTGTSAQPSGGTPSTGTTGGTTSGNTTAGTTTSGSTGTTGTTGASGTTAGTATSGSNASTSGSQGGNDLLGKTYAQLVGMGVPVQCDVTITENGKTVQTKLYLDGNQMRSEYTVPSSEGSTCTQYVTIVKDSTAYMGCANGNLFPDTGGASNPFAGCKWMEFTANKTAATGATGGVSQAPDYTNIPATQISCTPWVLDPSKFVIDGKACDLSQIMGQATSGYPTGQ